LFESSAIDEIDAAMAEAALRQLPADAREIVVMRLWGDLGYSAIAAVLGVSVSTAHARYQSSLKQLREIMEQTCKTSKQI
jgi:RNA polymerase sigma-70 factor (ECF subfamily)